MPLDQLVRIAEQVTNIIALRIVWPIVIILGGVIAGKIVKNIMIAIGKAIELDKHSKQFLDQTLPTTDLVAGGFAAIIYTVAVVAALVAAGVISIALKIVFVFFGLILLTAFLVWIAEVGPNFLSGLRYRRKIRVGDTLSIQSISGEVIRVGRLSLQLKNGEDIYDVQHRALSTKDVQALQRYAKAADE